MDIGMERVNNMCSFILSSSELQGGQVFLRKKGN